MEDGMRVINLLPVAVLAWNPGSRTLKPKRRRFSAFREATGLEPITWGVAPKARVRTSPKKYSKRLT